MDLRHLSVLTFVSVYRVRIFFDVGSAARELRPGYQSAPTIHGVVTLFEFYGCVIMVLVLRLRCVWPV